MIKKKHTNFYIIDGSGIIFESIYKPENLKKYFFDHFYIAFVKNGNHDIKKIKKYDSDQKNSFLKATRLSERFSGDTVILSKTTGYKRHGKDLLQAESLLKSEHVNKDELKERISKAFKNWVKIFKRLQDDAIDKRTKEVAKFYRDIEKLVLKNMKGIDQLKLIKNAPFDIKAGREYILKALIDEAFKGYEDELEKYTDKIIKSGLKEAELFADLGYRHITDELMPDELRKDVLEFAEREIRKTAGKNSLEIFQTSRDIIQRSLSEGILDKKPFAEIIEDVQGKFENMSTLKARVVATTEMGDIANFASLEGAIKGGATHKEFAWSGVERESHAAIDGSIVKIDEPWITGDGNLMFWPNSPSLPPEERINCTCNFVPLTLTSEEADALGVEKRAITVKCKGCGNEVDYKSEQEVAMGAIKCPSCNLIINQLGDVLKIEIKCKDCEDETNEQIHCAWLSTVGKYNIKLNKKEKQKLDPTTVQTLIFDKNKFKTAESAIKWAKDHDFKTDKVDETEDSFRLRQRDPNDFDKKTFRTIDITDGIQVVIGRLKKGKGKTSVVNDHLHTFDISKTGFGRTSKDNGHDHEIESFKIQDAKGHTHELIFEKSDIEADWKNLSKKDRWISTLTLLDIKEKKFRKEIKIAKVDKEKRMVYGLVYEPDVLDAHNEFSTEEDIEKGCNGFMENILLNGFSGLNFMHKDAMSKGDAIVIQNWTQKGDGQIGEQIAKKGSWWIGVKIFNDSLLDLIVEGKITGFSMEGTASAKKETETH